MTDESKPTYLASRLRNLRSPCFLCTILFAYACLSHSAVLPQLVDPLFGSRSLADDKIPTDAPHLDFFESKIRPVLAEHCYACHNSQGQSDGGLVLDWRGGVLAGSDNGPIVSPGTPESSRLISVIKHVIEGMEMPQGGPKLPDSVIADFEKWIREGIADPRNSPPSKEQYESETSWSATFARRLDWWSLHPIAPKSITPLNQGDHDDSSLVSQDQPSLFSSQLIDQLIDRDLKTAGLTRQRKGSPTQLVRRLYQNLIGLPPSEFELIRGVESIQNDNSLESLVDELLARPEFGEKWARHWMDWIRYADSHGSEGDPSIDNAWLYRDYLVRAINKDVSYDRMLQEHIAGDLVDNPRLDQETGVNESIIAMAHWRMVFHGFFPTDALDEKVRFIDDQINVFSKAFLGLTVSCSRCHDHKFDPISQEDYYALFAVFNSSRPSRAVSDVEDVQRLHAKELQDLKHRIREELCKEWLASREKLLHELVTRREFPSVNGTFRQTLKTWQTIKNALERGESLEAFRNSMSSDQPPLPSGETRWRFQDGSYVDDWIASGFGVSISDDRHPKISKAGEFRVSLQGDAFVTELLPSGVYSGLLSTKHAARLSSQDFTLAPGQHLWALVRGGGEAIIRGVVQDYPRMGGIYPFTKPSGDWRWERIDMSYWEGDSIHIEIAHAQDTVMPISDSQRSWFGVREVIVTSEVNPPPTDLQRSNLWKSILAADGNPTIDTLASLLVEQILQATKAWNEDSLSDEQAILLDEFLQAGMLPNRSDQFSTEGAESLQKLLDEYRHLEHEIKQPTRVPSIEETRGRTQHLYIRGNHKQPAQIVKPNFLSALPHDQTVQPFHRLQLANELLRHDNPIVHRVIVNRIWHHLFGRGIVATPDNFGKLGDTPTNQDLLDTLVLLFREQGTSLKSLIKTVVLSDTWQSDSRPSEEAIRLDPDNRLWSHCMVRRLDAEAIRDSLLSISGELDPTKFGPPVGGDSNRRGVYVRVQRNNLDSFLRAFDFPEPFATTGSRDSTNVPAQSLAMMNDPQITRLVNAWAQKLLLEPNANLSTSQRIEKMFVQALARYPTAKEAKMLSSYFEDSVRSMEAEREAADKIIASKVAAQKRMEELVSVARERYVSARGEPAPKAGSVHPSVRFDFENGPTDESGTISLQLVNGAKILDGALIVDGRGYAISSMLPSSLISKPLTAKTLETWVQLDGLDQRGGGVASIQSSDGSRFDSIVFGEQTPRKWMAGSEFFARTKALQGTEENEADKRSVHIAIVYRDNGEIAAYRDGQPYGVGYQSGGVLTFDPSESALSFGVRHLPASNGKMLVGKIFEARLYDRALSDADIASSFEAFQHGFQLSLLPELLTPDEFSAWNELQKLTMQLQQEYATKNLESHVSPELQAISDIGRSIFMMKEFLFVR